MRKPPWNLTRRSWARRSSGPPWLLSTPAVAFSTVVKNKSGAKIGTVKNVVKNAVKNVKKYSAYYA